jgi:hypothetical protein
MGDKKKGLSGGTILAVLAIAQKLGNYENKRLAIGLVIGASLAFLWALIVWVREFWARLKARIIASAQTALPTLHAPARQMRPIYTLNTETSRAKIRCSYLA